MFGYPGVNLVTGGGIQWALERQSLSPQRIVLPPGGHARSTLTLLRWQAGDGTAFTPARAYVTPPDETTYATVAWPSGVVLIRQDEATHPGTFIGPVTGSTIHSPHSIPALHSAVLHSAVLWSGRAVAAAPRARHGGSMTARAKPSPRLLSARCCAPTAASRRPTGTTSWSGG